MITELSVPEYRFDYVLSLFDKMNDEYNAIAGDNFSAALIRGYMAELFAFICRAQLSLAGADAFESVGSGAILEPNIQQAAQFISEHYQEAISLADVAAPAYMSESYFSTDHTDGGGKNRIFFLNGVLLPPRLIPIGVVLDAR